MTHVYTNASSITKYESWLCAAAEQSMPATALSVPPLRPGALVCGERFVLGAVLGQGGMGVVYEAYDIPRRASVALKTLLDVQPARLLAFKDEFRALQGVRDPNLVQLGELFEEDGRWFFTMEKIDGVPFSRYVREGRLNEERLRSALAQLARGLGVLHGLGKVHRDVKPSNVLVQPDGRLVLLDFGLLLDLSHESGTRHRCAGTAAYMAPEQAEGQASPASDFYSVGVMLYEALAGALPFDGDTESILALKASDDPPPLSIRGVNVPSDLEALCRALLDRAPSQRPLAGEVLDRLGITARHVRAPASPSSSRDSAPLFAERTAELVRITRAFQGAREGGATALLVRGEERVGKSRLLACFADALQGRALVFTGRCHEHEFIPFNAVDGVMDALARYLDALHPVELASLLPSDLSTIGQIFPVLATVGERIGRAQEPEPLRDGHASKSVRDPHDARRRAFVALRELFRRIAAERPFAIVIDDLHLADDDSLALIRDISSGPDAPPVFWLLAARSQVETAGERCLAELPTLPLQPIVGDGRERGDGA